MSTTVRAPSRPVAQRRRVRRRRRRGLRLGGLLVAATVGIVLALPTLRGADASTHAAAGARRHHPPAGRPEALDPALIAAVIYAETKFDPRTSSAGAEGLMQILPATAMFLARKSGATTFTTADLATPQVNIAYGSYYLRYLLDEYHGDETLALAAYNGGEANVDRWRGRRARRRPAVQPGGDPFPETRDYVAKVEHAAADYRRDYASQLGL